MRQGSQVLLVAVIAMFGLGAACGPKPGVPRRVDVTTDGRTFTPAEIHLRVGDVIEFANSDTVAHTAVDKGGHWTATIPPQSRQPLVMTDPGTFEFFCREHKDAVGRVIVEDVFARK
jgi:plastocyanin